MSEPATIHPQPVTHSNDEVLVRVEGVSKKFCRSLKKSLWYGVCDIAGELLPGRKRRETRDEGRGTRDEGRELSDRSAQDISRSPLDAGLSTAAASALDSGPSTPPASVLIRDISGKKSSSALDPRLSTPRTVSVRASSSPSKTSASNFAGGIEDPGTVRKRDFG